MPGANDWRNGIWGQSANNYFVQQGNATQVVDGAWYHNYHNLPVFAEPLSRRPTEDWLSKYGKKCEDKHQKRLAKKALEEEGSVINNFLIGCDPEWVAQDEKGSVVRLTGIIEHEGEVGYDHDGRVGEFRPSPSKGAYSLVKKLQTLVKSNKVAKIMARAKKLRGGARAGNESLGGHVHFGFSSPIMYDLNTGLRKIDERVAALDKVTKLFEDLDILPRNESQARRHGEYGRWSDIRDSGGHMEYRTMASWMYDPKVAYLCLTAAKLAAADPKGTLESLTTATSFGALTRWLERYSTKDSNAKRAVEKITEHRSVVVDPDVDFRGRWEKLGI